MKKTTKQIGDEAELQAVDYLVNNGFLILETNYRYKRSEIDIIAQKNNVLHIVEVKFRSNNDFGYPEEFVDARKAEMIELAADFYMEQNNWNGFVQYDIIAITKAQLVHLEDSF